MRRTSDISTAPLLRAAGCALLSSTDFKPADFIRPPLSIRTKQKFDNVNIVKEVQQSHTAANNAAA
jgi:hypothetical protein